MAEAAKLPDVPNISTVWKLLALHFLFIQEIFTLLRSLMGLRSRYSPAVKLKLFRI